VCSDSDVMWDCVFEGGGECGCVGVSFRGVVSACIFWLVC